MRFCMRIDLELEAGKSTAPLTGKSQRLCEVGEVMQAAHAHTPKPKMRRDNANQRAAVSEKTGKPYSTSSIRTR